MLNQTDTMLVSREIMADLVAILDKDKLDQEDAGDLEAFIFESIDRCAIIKKEMEDEEERLRLFAKEFSDAAKKTKNRREKFVDFVRLTMEQRGYDAVNGTVYNAVLRTNNPKVIMDTPTPSIFDAQAYPELVRTKWEWDLIAIKEISKKVDLRFVQIVQDTRVEFVKGKIA